MHAPLISVIIVVYNRADKIKTALESIIAQSFPDYELVVIDGGSTDGTVAVIKNFEPRISYWCAEPDRGIYDAMNKGIRNARGQWLYFLGSDDALYGTDVFSRIAQQLISENPDLLYGNVLLMPQNKKYAGAFSENRILADNISHQAIFYKKEVFENIGNYNLRYVKHADWDLNIRCFMDHSLKILYTDTIIAFFNTGGAGAGHDIVFLKERLIPERLRRLKDNKRIIQNIIRYDEYWRLLRNSGISKDELHAATNSDAVRAMYTFQSRIPKSLLRLGVVSKLCMLLSYLTFRIFRLFNIL